MAKADCAVAILAGTRTGKSTMIGNLIMDDEYQYLSDDIVLYDEKTNNVIPYPIPLKLRDLSHVPYTIRKFVIAQGYNPQSNEIEYYVKMKTECTDVTAMPTYKLGAFILLDRAIMGHGEVRYLQYQEATKYLILNSRKPGHIYIRNMATSATKIARNIPVLLVRYIDVDEGKRTIDSIMSRLIESLQIKSQEGK